MVIKKHYTAELSEKGQELIQMFNSISAPEQSVIVDILYDALYDRNIRLVMAGRIDKEYNDKLKTQEETINKLQNLIKELEKRPKNIDIAYSEIPKEERKELKKEIINEFMHRDMMKNLNELRTENFRCKAKLREMGIIM